MDETWFDLGQQYLIKLSDRKKENTRANKMFISNCIEKIFRERKWYSTFSKWHEQNEKFFFERTKNLCVQIEEVHAPDVGSLYIRKEF